MTDSEITQQGSVERGGIASKVALDSTKLMASSLLGQLLGGISTFVVARVLGPTDFGLLKIISFVPSLAKFGSLGFDSVAQREIPHLRGAGATPAEQRRVRSVAFTADLLWSSLLAAAIVVASFLYNSATVRYGLWITAITLLLGQITRLFIVVCSVDKRFEVIARVTAQTTLVNAVFVLMTVYWLGIFGVLGAALIAAGTGVYWYSRASRLDFDWLLARAEVLRQLRVAAPLAGVTIGFGLFAWVERVQVLQLFGSEALGLYMLVVAVYEMGMLFLNAVLRALGVHLYERLGQSAHSTATEKMILLPTLLMACALPFAGGVIWIIVPPLILTLLPHYSETLVLFPWLIVTMTVRGISAVPMTAMTSARYNMQSLSMMLWVVATGVFASVTWLGSNLGWGIEGAAIGKAVAFTVLAVISVIMIVPSVLGRRSFAETVALMLAPLVVTMLFVLVVGSAISLSMFWEAGLKGLLFVMAYVPLLVFLEWRTQLFSKALRPAFLQWLRSRRTRQ